METLDKIIKLIDEKGIEQRSLADYLGIHPQVITDWKSKRSKSYTRYIPQIAKFFSVTAEYLQGTQAPEETTAQNNDERKVLLLARKAQDIPEEDREQIIEAFQNSIDLYLRAKRKKD